MISFKDGLTVSITDGMWDYIRVCIRVYIKVAKRDDNGIV